MSETSLQEGRGTRLDEDLGLLSKVSGDRWLGPIARLLIRLSPLVKEHAEKELQSDLYVLF